MVGTPVRPIPRETELVLEAEPGYARRGRGRPDAGPWPRR
jgi:hypothetical protein